MQQYLFWKNWERTQKTLYLFALILFATSIGFYLISYFYGASSVINWVVVSQLKNIGVEAINVNTGPVSLKSDAVNYLITSFFEGSNLKINHLAVHLFLGVFVICIAFYLALITFLSRFWYIIAAVIFMVVLIGFKLDQLLLFGRYDNLALYICLAIYLPVSYYFHAFSKDISVWKRIITFLFITIAIGIFIFLFAEVNDPALYLVNYGILFPVSISVIFIFIVAMEVVVGFLYIITNSNNQNSKNSLPHFVIICFIYLGNLGLVFLKNRKFIDWDFYYIDEFFLLLVSVLIGIWGYRHRSVIFSEILPFKPIGGVLYLVLATICFSTIGYLFATANDPLIETIEDTIVFSHLSFGFFFFIYIISNFVGLLHDNFQVIKIIYKPQRMPYFVFRFIGLVGVAALFFQANQLAMNQAIAGYYNGIGDLYISVDNANIAKQYYNLASQFEFQNHRSNYGLASIATQQQDKTDAIYFYKHSLLKEPTPYAYANLANIYYETGQFFDALFTLNDGIAKFPNSKELYNNIGLLYAQTDVIDSASFFFNMADDDQLTGNIASSNLLALYAEKGIEIDPDSLFEAYTNRDYLPIESNLLVLFNKNKINYPIDFKKKIFNDTSFNLHNFSYIYDFSFNKTFKSDTSLVKEITSLSQKLPYLSNNEPLYFINALSRYKAKNNLKAFKSLELLQLNNPDKSGYYNNLLGLWAMQQNAPLLAADFFEKAEGSGFPEARTNKIMAWMESGLPEKVKSAIDQLTNGADSTNNRIINSAIRLLNKTDFTRFDDLDDSEKYWCSKVYQQVLDQETIDKLIKSIENEDIRVMSICDYLSKKLKFSSDNHSEKYIKFLEGVNVQNKELSERVFLIKARYHASKNNLQALEAAINNPIFKGPNKQLEQLYLRTVIDELKGNDESATRSYLFLMAMDPFDEEIILRAVNYLQKNKANETSLYDHLLAAVSLNAYSPELLKAYILYCLQIGLTDYAERELELLESLLSEQAFDEFYQQYQSALSEQVLSDEIWE